MPFAKVYDSEENDNYEHINPSVVFTTYIQSTEPDGYTEVIVVDIGGNHRMCDFLSVKEAKRFIDRLGA